MDLHGDMVQHLFANMSLPWCHGVYHLFWLMGIDFFHSWGLFVHSSPWHPRPVGQPRLPEFGPTESDCLILCSCVLCKELGLVVWKCSKSSNCTRITRTKPENNDVSMHRCIAVAALPLPSGGAPSPLQLPGEIDDQSRMWKKDMRMSDTVKRFKT